MLVKLPEHSLVLILARPQSIANFAAGGRFLLFPNLIENGRVPFGDLPILLAMGHSEGS